MNGTPTPVAVVVFGVCGAGKSTISALLAKERNYKYLDADDFHPESNKDKMKRGIPLTDEDRIPWLEILRDVLKDYLIAGVGVVLACSALQKQYREILGSADPNYKSGSNNVRSMKFVLLDAPADVLAVRLNKRAEEGMHFMPASLLHSQLELLEIEDSERIIKVDATLPPETIVSNIQRNLP